MSRTALIVALTGILLSGPALAETVDELIAANVAARGGLERILAVRSVRGRGTISLGGAGTAPFTWTWKHPNRVRLEFVYHGMTSIQAFDGKTAWVVMPLVGKTQPEPLPDDLSELFALESDFTGPLVDYRRKGHRVELLGQEEVDGTPAWKLRVALPGGHELTVFLATSSGLEIRQEIAFTRDGQPLVVEATMGDYREVDGIRIAHTLTSKPKGAATAQQMTFDEIVLNVPVDEAIFEMTPRR